MLHIDGAIEYNSHYMTSLYLELLAQPIASPSTALAALALGDLLMSQVLATCDILEVKGS